MDGISSDGHIPNLIKASGLACCLCCHFTVRRYFRNWPFPDMPTVPENVGYWG
jgi:hypothetical protein